ncbi:2OG-Fe(II) oxygenase [Candidatus Woesearchaeota archaeon]|nr:2OG-Fe(II) oxygenase [Candidatus Woesearchaeota archaeon]
MADLHRWISERYLPGAADPSLLQQQFVSGSPFPHIVLHDFLLPGKAEQLRAALLGETWGLKDADLFRFHQTKDIRYSGSPLIKEYHAFFSSQEFRSLISAITGVSPLSSIDGSGQKYAGGDYLLPHDDRLEGRKIAYVMNLTKDFTEKDGGQLQFFAVDGKTGHPTVVEQSFVPAFNTLFLFRVSKKSFHQVAEVVVPEHASAEQKQKGRLSIAGWFHG